MTDAAPTSTPEEPATPVKEDWSPRAWLALLRDLYFQMDRRTLGFSRILLGFLLLMDVIHRGRFWLDMYSSIGVLPTLFNLQHPQNGTSFTIFNAFDSPGEVKVLWTLMVVNAVCLMVGYRTRVAQMCALVLQTSLNGRVLLFENGGYVVNNLLVLWTMFLPMGDRFSVDALIASFRRRKETTAAELNDRSQVLAPGVDAPFTSLMGFVVTVQIAAMYYFNAIHKTGPAWHNGTAVHFVLYVDRMATPMISAIRDHVPNVLILFMTRATMMFEAAIPITLLQPLGRAWARRAVIFMMCTLHIAFGTTFVLGPFAWSCCIFATLLFSSDDWEIAGEAMRRPRRARTVRFDPRSGAALAVCRLLQRLDRFELLTFEAAGEKLPLGIALAGVTTAHDTVADLVAALPLGPVVAWVPRAPVVRSVVDALLGVIERRDMSHLLGLSAAPRADRLEPTLPGTPRIPVLVVVLSALQVAGAVAIAFRRDQPWSGVFLVLGTTAVTAAIATWFVFPVVTVNVVRRAVVGSLREIIVLAVFAGAVNQGLVEMWCFNRRFKTPQPEALRLLSHKLRFLQGWFMFSPNPVVDDGTIVVDALTVDGRHIDPFTGKEPYWELTKSLGLTQMWCDYFNRMQLPGNAGSREPMKDYMFRLPDRTGHPEDAIVSGDVYWVKAMNPRWNETQKYNYERSKVFSFENLGARRPRP